jgi:hypothetical protein
MLLEVHNVHPMQCFMAAVRTAVQAGAVGALEASLPLRDSLPPPAATTPSTAMAQVMPQVTECVQGKIAV